LSSVHGVREDRRQIKGAMDTVDLIYTTQPVEMSGKHACLQVTAAEEV